MITKTLSEFALKTSYDSIPKEAVVAAKKALLDYLGVTVAGSRDSAGRIVTAFVKEEGGNPVAGVIAGGFKTSPFFAAFSNGVMGHALDFDDECESWNSHPSVAILPAVLALGEKLGTSGKDLLTAYILGWEVAARIGASNGYFRVTEHGYHATSALGTLSGAAASARVLKLSTEQTMMAFGIGASQASGLIVNFGTDTKPFHAGLAASNGLRSAQLAKQGFTACADILDNPNGYFKTMMDGVYDPSNLDGLGKSYDIMSSLCIKAYPCCYCNQRPLDSIFHLIKEHNIRSDDVAEIEAKAYPLQIKVMPYAMPKTGLEAKFSLQYSLATALVHGAATLKEYTEEKVLDPRVQELLPKIKVIAVEGVGIEDYTHCASGQMVTVKLKDGKEYSYDSVRPRGHSSNPMDWDEVAEKFRACTEETLAQKDAERCVELVGQFESLGNVAELMSILTKA